MSTTPNLAIPHILQSQAQKAVTANEAFDQLDEAINDQATLDASGGNKTRKLEYALAAALNEQADTVITAGGLQSNHVRQTAAAAAKLGLRCALVLEPSLIRTAPRPHGPFQGWRYLRGEDAPPDLGLHAGDAEMPAEMMNELKELGLL